jgi:Zn-dependent protease with chaperone function
MASLITSSLPNSTSRLCEVQADVYAVRSTGNPDAAISYLRKVSAQANLESGPPEVMSMFLENHPPVSDRIRFVEVAKALQTAK